ncbi:hypothetical protein Sjap_017098 [Stephania japonica]|uniref:Uncharacterized protein n=1 Tax=Stephania japonica TaxID=461633 RepID=A0AAP0I5L8_9MAGN
MNELTITVALVNPNRLSILKEEEDEKEAYVNLLYGDEFLLGVRVLGKSIRDTGSTKDMVVLVSEGVSEYAENLFQMEESEKRRERLKAMRMEAAQANASHNVDTSTVPTQLSNPLIDSLATMENSSTHTRFDFYTDPMAAFSAGARNFDMSTPLPQFHHRGASSGPWNQSGGRASYGFSPNSQRFGGYPNPGFRRGGSYSGSPNSGRGSGGRFSSSPSPHWGRGGGRGRGFHASVSAKERPEMFYNKSMMEDPWSSLIPIVKNLSISAGSQSTPGSLNSWLPKSLSMKKARVAEPASTPNSQISLADSLSAAVEEASNEAE